MTVLLGLLVCLTGLPFVIRSMVQSNADVEAILEDRPTPAQLRLLSPVVATVPATPPAGTVAATSQQDSPAPAVDAAPDLKPVATPHQVKAGEVRRAQGPPCHDCHCCSVYAARMVDAHHEIERLQDELLAGDARRVNLLPLPKANVVPIRP